MVTRKNSSQLLKAKYDKFLVDLQKVQSQKEQLVLREKELKLQSTKAYAEYIVALMSESGKSMKEIEDFAKGTSSQQLHQNGGDSHVQSH